LDDAHAQETDAPTSFDALLGHAARLVFGGNHRTAAQIVEAALGSAAASGAGWLLPVEPVIHSSIQAHPALWGGAPARLKNAAA
jgi:hypothetical protein